MNDNLKKLIKSCNDMDISNQIATFGDAYSPLNAAVELIALEKTVEDAVALGWKMQERLQTYGLDNGEWGDAMVDLCKRMTP